MGFFDRFKKNKNANKKVKRVERKRKAIDKQPDIEESQLALREIAVNSKNRHERAQATDSITNQYVALDIAKHVTDRAIRLIAANKIQDEDLLWDAAAVSYTHLHMKLIMWKILQNVTDTDLNLTMITGKTWKIKV